MAASDHDPGDEYESPPPAPPSGPAKFEPPTIRIGGASLSCFQSPTVHIEVGVAPDVDNLLVHETLLCKYSVFFRKALKGNFKEAKSKKISLPDEDPYMFLRVIRWLYTGEIYGGHSGPSFSEMFGFYSNGRDEEIEDDDDDEEHDEEHNILIHRLADLWILGDKFQMPALQNAAARGLIEHTIAMRSNLYTDRGFPRAALIEHVYTNTLPDSPLRSLIIDMAILSRKQERVRSIMDTVSLEIVVALAKRSYHFLMAADKMESDPYMRLRHCWKSYGVGDDVAEEDLFVLSASCPPPAACDRGPWAKPCDRCERMIQEEQRRNPWIQPPWP